MFFSVKGYKPVIGTTEEVFICNDQNQLRVYLNTHGPEAGGFVQYSTTEIEDIPDSHLFQCPHCTEKFPHPSKVVDLTAKK